MPVSSLLVSRIAAFSDVSVFSASSLFPSSEEVSSPSLKPAFSASSSLTVSSFESDFSATVSVFVFYADSFVPPQPVSIAAESTAAQSTAKVLRFIFVPPDPVVVCGPASAPPLFCFVCRSFSLSSFMIIGSCPGNQPFSVPCAVSLLHNNLPFLRSL